ncbi:GntR family transcriptional regulator [Actinokineospora bangkokensis]|uniref:GntR family transcriptional regulator n=1 Tax=Actinokineospora bangkokensis TaxID=1193682 RepID=A0A1Q9LKI6_9PSEU|nr:GntR family transcriptional regulator [Actinokineospora bangkokensis]OLR92530.1 GntR family transcriptional regulator [Actinokineospora bangkokensis]
MPGPRRRSALIALLTREPGAAPQAAILDELRRALLEGGVPPGTAIPLDEVAAVFGVSRIPVREALKTLIGEGLVEHRTNAGYTVAKLTPAELAEMYLVREALETAALAAALPAAGPADDDAARAAHEALEAAIAAGDVTAHHRESRRFHFALVSPCGMHRLLKMFESAWNITEPVRPMAHIAPGDRSVLHDDHADMLAAFVARDAEALLSAARAHHSRLASLLGAVPQHTGLLAERGPGEIYD